VRIESYAGYRGQETPRRLIFGAKSLEVREVIDRWLAPDYRYFKVRCEDGCVYILRHDLEQGEWELTSFDCRAVGEGSR
jgi:hypothetical protein